MYTLNERRLSYKQKLQNVTVYKELSDFYFQNGKQAADLTNWNTVSC